MKKQLKTFAAKIKNVVWPYLDTAVEDAPVYYEDTGDKMGTVTRVIRDADGDPTGYRVRHEETGVETTLDRDALQRTRQGLLFVPLWYSEARALLRKLEYMARHPGLRDVVDWAALTDRELHDVASSHPDMRHTVAHARRVRRSLEKQRRELERKRRGIREHLMELSEQRLLRDIGRRAFAEGVMEARRRARILGVNIERCSDLLVRFDALPFLPKQAPAHADIPEAEEDIMPLKDVMHNIPISVAVMDREAVIRSVNEQFTENLRYTPDEVKGKPLPALVVEGTQPLKDICADGDGEARDVEFTIRDGRGRNRHMYGRAMPVTGNGHGPVVALAFQEKMDESDEFREMLTNQISHEFFNPLCIAQGYLYLLDEGKYGDLTPEQQRQVRSIAKNLKRIEHLVKQTVQVKP
ncbi:MAG: PAS domain-containing protein [Thermoplasmatota archaeon]